MRSHNKRTTAILSTILLSLVLTPVAGLAQSSGGGNYKITSSVVAGGGAASTGSGSKVIDGTGGQSAAGGPQTNSSISHLSGFWPATLAEPKPQQGGQVMLQFSAASYLVQENLGALAITVTRSGDASVLASVEFSTVDGAATQKSDFEYAAGKLTFAPGETSKTFTLLINEDMYVDFNETFAVSLNNPSGAVLGPQSTASITITDDSPESQTNPIDDAQSFVHMQYHDFLNRDPDANGLAFWTDNIAKCEEESRRPAGQTAAQCFDKQRESTAIAFFMSPEFQITGGFVYHLYKGSLSGAPNYDGGSPGRFPTSQEFLRDVSQVSEGIVVNNQISGAMVEANRDQLAADFVQRPEFMAKYGGLNNSLYVQELFNTTGIPATAAEKQSLVDGLNSATMTRAAVLRKIVDGTVVISEGNVQFTTPYGQAFINQENRRVFVFMEYVGYLRREPDGPGFIHWLGKLNFYSGDPFQAEMVRAFILSPEYRQRFGQ